MRSAKAMLASAICLLVVVAAALALWFATMPYPIEDWWAAWQSLRYSDEWPISESDFATAIGLVKQELGWREIITKVSVPGPGEIRITSLLRWRHGFAGEGRCFIVKKVNGEWAIAERIVWFA